MKKLFILAFVVLGLSGVSFGQVTATAASSATIITPIAITNSAALNFGSLAVSSANGTVLLTPLETATRTEGGGVTLPLISEPVSAAKFTVTGLAASTYSISLPTGDITLTDGGTNTMTVGLFTSTPSISGTLAGGSDDIYVGATINVAGDQAAGAYTNSADLAVTVNYN